MIGMYVICACIIIIIRNSFKSAHNIHYCCVKQKKPPIKTKEIFTEYVEYVSK